MRARQRRTHSQQAKISDYHPRSSSTPLGTQLLMEQGDGIRSREHWTNRELPAVYPGCAAAPGARAEKACERAVVVPEVGTHSGRHAVLLAVPPCSPVSTPLRAGLQQCATAAIDAGCAQPLWRDSAAHSNRGTPPPAWPQPRTLLFDCSEGTRVGGRRGGLAKPDFQVAPATAELSHVPVGLQPLSFGAMHHENDSVIRNVPGQALVLIDDAVDAAVRDEVVYDVRQVHRQCSPDNMLPAGPWRRLIAGMRYRGFGGGVPGRFAARGKDHRPRAVTLNSSDLGRILSDDIVVQDTA